MVLKVATFRTPCTNKEQVMKVAEEMLEVFAAWQAHEATGKLAEKGAADRYEYHMTKTDLADEIADVITAACNLAKRYDLDMKAAMERCESRNRERGRL